MTDNAQALIALTQKLTDIIQSVKHSVRLLRGDDKRKENLSTLIAQIGSQWVIVDKSACWGLFIAQNSAKLLAWAANNDAHWLKVT